MRCASLQYASAPSATASPRGRCTPQCAHATIASASTVGRVGRPGPTDPRRATRAEEQPQAQPARPRARPGISRLPPSGAGAPEQDFEHEARSRVRQQQQECAGVEPARRLLAAPTTPVSPGEQGAEHGPAKQRQHGLVIPAPLRRGRDAEDDRQPRARRSPLARNGRSGARVASEGGRTPRPPRRRAGASGARPNRASAHAAPPHRTARTTRRRATNGAATRARGVPAAHPETTTASATAAPPAQASTRRTEGRGTKRLSTAWTMSTRHTVSDSTGPKPSRALPYEQPGAADIRCQHRRVRADPDDEHRCGKRPSIPPGSAASA